MVVVQKVNQRLIKAQKAFVAAYYEDNVFYADDPQLFFQLWKLKEDHKDDWLQELEDNLIYRKVKTWLEGLFKKDDSPAATHAKLELEDIVKLVFNNITKIPGCKYELKKLINKS